MDFQRSARTIIDIPTLHSLLSTTKERANHVAQSSCKQASLSTEGLTDGQ